jgi:hypothetical protein
VASTAQTAAPIQQVSQALVSAVTSTTSNTAMATGAPIQSSKVDLNKQKKEELERKLEVIQKELSFKATPATQSGQKKSKKGKIIGFANEKHIFDQMI